MVPYLSALGASTIAFWTIGLVRALVFGPRADDGAPQAARFFDIRRWVYFVVCGILMGVADTAMLVTPGWLDWQAWARNSSFGANLALSGALGGLVYWWLAVRDPALETAGQSRQARAALAHGKALMFLVRS